MFERIADFTELLMPDDLLSPTSILAELRKVMTVETCADVEVIGWLLQFYISEKKDGGVRRAAQEQEGDAGEHSRRHAAVHPALDVKYLVQNSLGRLWMLNQPPLPRLPARWNITSPAGTGGGFSEDRLAGEIRICDPAVAPAIC